MSKPLIKINVVSDVVCPWCYVGKRRLEKAIHKLSDKYEFEVEYSPFELNPQMPKGGMSQKDYLSKKFGGEARYEQITAHTTAVAETEGLAFHFDRQKVSPNTRDAHRVIQLANKSGKQLALVEALFKAYFTDGVDLSDHTNLIAIAVACGMNEEEVRDLLQGESGVVEIEMKERQLQQLGISGVPFYIIDNRFGISGAQQPEAFIQAFDDVATAALADAVNAPACDMDSNDC